MNNLAAIPVSWIDVGQAWNDKRSHVVENDLFPVLLAVSECECGEHTLSVKLAEAFALEKSKRICSQFSISDAVDHCLLGRKLVGLCCRLGFLDQIRVTLFHVIMNLKNKIKIFQI